MSKKIVFVVILLVIGLISAYLIWLRYDLAPKFTAPVQKVEDIGSPLPEATQVIQTPAPVPASPSATKTASPSAKPR